MRVQLNTVLSEGQIKMMCWVGILDFMMREEGSEDKVIINNLRYKVYTTFQPSDFHRFARRTREEGSVRASSPRISALGKTERPASSSPSSQTQLLPSTPHMNQYILVYTSHCSG
jgi:hypothetical protein